MVYRALGLMSGSSLDGLDLAFVELNESGGRWSFELIAADCYPYDVQWSERLRNATSSSALEYQLLHTDYGRYTGQMVNRFIDQYELHFKVGLVSSHGHTTFHLPQYRMTAQLGDGAAIAAETRLPVVSDLRALDVAFGGQGAPIVPIGEKFLFAEYPLLLNIGGIANLSVSAGTGYLAFDVCAANRVLNLLANEDQKEYDRDGEMAALGNISDDLLTSLNKLNYYQQPPPKSLANGFGTDEVYPMIKSFGLTHNDGLRTYTEHIAIQITEAVKTYAPINTESSAMLVTGGGALNQFLIDRLKVHLANSGIEVIVPEKNVIQYKEAIIMALIGVLRWRQEYNVLASVTGAERDSIGGAVWIGQEA